MTHPFQSLRLSDMLRTRGLASPEQLSSVAGENDIQLGKRLVQQGVLSDVQLSKLLAEQFNLPYVDVERLTVQPTLFEKLPAVQAYELNVIPVNLHGDTIEIAISDPYNLNLPARLARITGLRVKLVLTTSSAIHSALKRSQGTAEVLKGMSEDFRLVMIKETDEGNEQSISLEKFGDEASPVVRLINTMLIDALAKRASDIHIEAYEKGVTVKYRIDGVLYPAMETLDRSHHSALISRLKVMAELDIAEKRIPQDGRFKLRRGNRDIDFRISIIPGVFGEDVVIRILDKTSITEGLRTLRLEGLGMAQEILKKFRRSILEPYGMVLITGPTGSGKTTSLYAALSELNSSEEKIITIEDPVEYQLEGIVQIPVNEKKGLTFAKGLRSILRHDPDKIMVGEIRDQETAQIAVQSALTGHLVFTTVHANNAFDVIGRFAHIGVDVYNFVSALNCVMAQRLVRLICPMCKHEVAHDPELLESSGLELLQYGSYIWHEGKGCDHCHGTGYRGRGAITEFLDLTPKLRQMILDRRPAAELQEIAISEGMITLRQSAINKALSGDTTLKEINRVTFVD